jgi:hypothetical protein
MTHHLLTQSGRASRFAPLRQKSAKHYIPDDGAVMVEVRPGQFINEAAAIGLGLVQPYAEALGHIRSGVLSGSPGDDSSPRHHGEGLNLDIVVRENSCVQGHLRFKPAQLNWRVAGRVPRANFLMPRNAIAVACVQPHRVLGACYDRK